MSAPFAIYTVEKRFDLTPQDVHIDAALSNILINYRPTGFIADQIFPIVPVAKQSDRFYKIDQGDRFRSELDYRAAGTEPNMISFDVSSDGYFCDNYALGSYLTAEELANADAVLNTRETRGQFLMDILMINYELRVARAVNSTSNVGSNTTTASAWGTDNADPYQDMQNDMASLEDLCGIKPNRVVFGKQAWRKCRDSDKMRSLLFPHGGGIPTTQQVQNLLEVDKVLIGGAYYNSAAEGFSQTLTKIWNDSVLYYYAPAVPSKEMPSYGYSFRWTVNGMPNMVVRTFPFDDKRGRQDMHVGYYQDEKLVDTNLAFLRTGVGSSQ